MIFWQSGTLLRAELREYPLTGKASDDPIKVSKSSAFTPSNNSSKVRAGNSPSLMRTRSAVRRERLARAIISSPPSKETFPSFTTTFSPPIRRISPARTLSSPNRQGQIKV